MGTEEAQHTRGHTGGGVKQPSHPPALSAECTLLCQLLQGGHRGQGRRGTRSAVTLPSPPQACRAGSAPCLVSGVPRALGSSCLLQLLPLVLPSTVTYTARPVKCSPLTQPGGLLC